ncbi:hypothetical protein ACSBR1_036898 [Camellia fascicularis]
MAKTDWDLSSLAQKLTNIHNHLQKQLDLCLQRSEEKGDIERFQGLVNLFQTTHIDNLKILKSLIYTKDDQLPLVDGSTKRRVSIDVLRRKNVLLLISNLDFSHEEHFILGQICESNAIHMRWIWGNMAFPCTTLTEEALWEGSTWTIELLADSIDQSILNWIKDGKYICLYGGENLDWIRRFTNRTRVVAEAAGIPLEMMYVGKNNPRKKVWKISSVILAEKLSHVLPDPTLIWFFCVRLESMWHSKMQHGKTIENDPIMNEIMTILSFDGSDKGWAVINQGKSEMAKAKGDTILKSLALFDQWKDRIGEVGFVNALNDNLNELLTPQHCDHLIFPCTAENIPETIVCATCKTHMEKFIMYRCCRD